MVELRKRKASESAPPPPMKKANSVKSTASSAKSTITDNKPVSNGSSTKAKVAVGDTITLAGFGGEVETNDGEKTTLMKLVEDSKNGVVLFTYPKASTPGCTTQACLFRDHYTPLTATGFSIYGLSMDSPKSNTTFKTKQNLPYTLLCDPSATLIAAIGMKKPPKSTTRGVFVVNKEGKVLAAEPGGPAATVEVVKKLLGEAEVSEDIGNVAEGEKVEKEIEEKKMGVQETEQPPVENGQEASKEDEVKADVAAEVADTAEKLDEGVKA